MRKLDLIKELGFVPLDRQRHANLCFSALTQG